MSSEAILTSEKDYTVFIYNDHRIRFASPYSLEKYTSVKSWDLGYLVVMAKYSHLEYEEEEYIDMIPILKDFYCAT